VNGELTRQAVIEAARRWLRPGITRPQALALGYAEASGQPLDPCDFDDAAVLLRAETLLLELVDVAGAVETARAEFATWNLEALR
jgi:hypothetical protein